MARLELLGKEGLEERLENNLGTAASKLEWPCRQSREHDVPELRETEPHDQGKLEDVVEWNPVGYEESGLKEVEERKDDPVSASTFRISAPHGQKGKITQGKETYVSH